MRQGDNTELRVPLEIRFKNLPLDISPSDCLPCPPGGALCAQSIRLFSSSSDFTKTLPEEVRVNQGNKEQVSKQASSRAGGLARSLGNVWRMRYGETWVLCGAIFFWRGCQF